MWISTLAAEAVNDLGRGPVVVWIAASVGGYASAIVGLFGAWRSERTAKEDAERDERWRQELEDASRSETTAEEDVERDEWRRQDLERASSSLAHYRVHSILRLHRLADLMLILAITAVVAGPLAGVALGSFLAGGIIGGIAGPAYTAHRRLEKAAAVREASADATALRNAELQRKQWELERDKRLFKLELEQKRAEQLGT